MLPPVYNTLRANAIVLAMVGNRIGRHGRVHQKTESPYIAWQVVTGLPHDQISGPPPSDFITVQIDCYHLEDGPMEDLAEAVRDALDAVGVSNRIVVNLRELDTKLYRIGFEADFITQR